MELPVSLSGGMLVHRKQNTKQPPGIHPLLRFPGAPALTATEQSEATAFTEKRRTAGRRKRERKRIKRARKREGEDRVRYVKKDNYESGR